MEDRTQKTGTTPEQWGHARECIYCQEEKGNLNHDKDLA